VAEVFISYSRADKPIAQAIAVELQRLGIDVWWDHDLLGGDDYRNRIAQILACAEVAFVVWSRNSIQSEWVLGEASAAKDKKILIPLIIDGCQPPLDFRAAHSLDFSSWVPGDQLSEPLLKALAERLDRQISYASGPLQHGAFSRLTRQAAQSWYRDVESMLFYYIGQGFACVVINIPLAVYSSKLPPWAPYLVAILNGIVVAAVYMRPALESRRMRVALPLFALAAAISPVSFVVTAWFYDQTSKEVFLTLTAFWVLALLFVTDIARRATP